MNTNTATSGIIIREAKQTEKPVLQTMGEYRAKTDGYSLSVIADLVPLRSPFSAKEFLRTSGKYEPVNDYTDLGQSRLFSKEFQSIARYSDGTGWLVYDGTVWREHEALALGLSQELTHRQKLEADMYVDNFMKQASEEVKDKGEMTQATKQALGRAIAYSNYVKGRRQHTRLNATLKEAVPVLYVETKHLDMYPFKLNTPAGTIDLRFGKMYKHSPNDLITKITSVSPSDKGKEVFLDFLDQITSGDKDLVRYLQEIAGMFTIGQVFTECLVIAYGSGGNGKSTYFNLLARVLGDYSCSIPSELLIQKKNHNKAPAKAELRGKRLAIASELEEGEHLDTGLVKKICSTDPIDAEPKYKKPFSFIPSHSTVLYTNHLPAISATDNGTWDRIVAIPFKARFRNQSEEVKNYADHLFNECGEYALKWMIEGAKRYIENNYKLVQPECVIQAISEYRKNSDLILCFLSDRCERNPNSKFKSSVLYEKYKDYCKEFDEPPKTEKRFKETVQAAGFSYKRISSGVYCEGLKLL